jgi:hypothetical protein
MYLLYEDYGSSDNVRTEARLLKLFYIFTFEIDIKISSNL